MSTTLLPFAQLPGEVLLDDRLTPTHVRVLIALYMHLNKKKDVVWPKRETLAKLTRLHESKISRATTELEALGWVTKVGNGGRSKSCSYQVHVPDHITSQFDVTVDERGDIQAPKTLSESETVSKTETVSDLDQNPSRIGHETLAKSARGIEQTMNRPEQTINKPTPAKLALPDWLPVESWQMWDRFRKKKSGAGWSADARRLSLSTLARLRAEGHDPTGVIEQSIERGWTGLFPLKNNPVMGAKKHGNFGLQDYHAGVSADGRF